MSQESAVIKIVVEGLGGNRPAPERTAALPVASTRAMEPITARPPAPATTPTTLYQPPAASARPLPAPTPAPKLAEPPTPQDQADRNARAAQLPTNGLLQAFPWLRGPLGARAAEPTREAVAQPQAKAPAAALTAAPCDCICECISRAVDTIVAHMDNGPSSPKPAPAKLTGGPEDQPEKKQKRPEVLTAKDLAAGIAMALGSTVSGHAQAIGSALGGSEQEPGAVAVSAGLDLAQKVAPMFGPAGAVVAAAAKTAAVGLEIFDAANRQAAKNLTAQGSIHASLITGDLIGAQRKYAEKKAEETGSWGEYWRQLKYGMTHGGRTMPRIGGTSDTLAKRAAAMGAFETLDRAASARANQLAPFSAEISTAQAQARAQQIQTAAKMAQTYGPQAAKLVATQGDYKVAAEQALAKRQNEVYAKLTEAYKNGLINGKEMLQQMEELNKKQNIGELLASNSEESKKLLADILKDMKKAREDREKGGAFNVGKMVDDFFKNFGFLPTMPPPNPFAAPTPPMTPLTVP